MVLNKIGLFDFTEHPMWISDVWVGTYLGRFRKIGYSLSKIVFRIVENLIWVGRSKNGQQNWISFMDGPLDLCMSEDT